MMKNVGFSYTTLHSCFIFFAYDKHIFLFFCFLPNNGTASDVAGIVSATIFKNTVNDNKIVTPV